VREGKRKREKRTEERGEVRSQHTLAAPSGANVFCSPPLPPFSCRRSVTKPPADSACANDVVLPHPPFAVLPPFPLPSLFLYRPRRSHMTKKSAKELPPAQSREAGRCNVESALPFAFRVVQHDDGEKEKAVEAAPRRGGESEEEKEGYR
jgi:hypothetical protein